MLTEIVMFLREAIPQPALLPALENAFGVSLESENRPNDYADGAITLVEYAEGFAAGIGIALTSPLPAPAGRAAQSLADMLDTEVLLENAEARQPGAQWLLFSPGASVPRPVRIVELRRGLAIAPAYERTAEDTETMA